LLKGDCVTVTGKSVSDNLAQIPDVPLDQDLLAPLDQPFKSYADMQICFGNIAPGGVVFKVSSMQNPTFQGPAICFDDAREIVDAVESKRIEAGMVIVLRNLGPVACGMPEVLVATAALAVPELDGKVAFLSDTRVSGVSHGAIGVHCSPEAAVGGPIALVENGDEISFDLLAGDIHLHVSDEQLANRRESWVARPSNYEPRAYLADFCATTAQAQFGCVSRAHYPQCS
jgi:dihydroxy-acid dehydratase